MTIPTSDLSDAELQQLVRRLHALGVRPIYEFLRELRDGADFSTRLRRYARLDAALIAIHGGDKFTAPGRPQ